MSGGPILGVIGTIVWDTIEFTARRTVEDWGGLAYSLAGAVAASERVRVRPIAKVGGDLFPSAKQLMASLPDLSDPHLVAVPERNNRVEVTYIDPVNRIERLTGGVPPWKSHELTPAIAECDALFVNFISGFEMELETARALRAHFKGPIHADLHSLFLGVTERGVRTPRSLPDAEAWLACFDSVQMNESERRLLERESGELMGLVEAPGGPDRAFVTLGGAGADLYHAADAAGVPASLAGAVRTVTLERSPMTGDPTGCGDVWGGAISVRLLEGDGPEQAARIANRLASAAVGVSGAGSLARHLIERSPVKK